MNNNLIELNTININNKNDIEQNLPEANEIVDKIEIVLNGFENTPIAIPIEENSNHPELLTNERFKCYIYCVLIPLSLMSIILILISLK
jgi:hypothetical protein